MSSKYIIKYFLLLISFIMCKNNPEGQKIKISTTEGDICLVLYDETRIHKENFIQKVKEGSYKGAPFHRIIQDFMIQAGEKPGNKKTKEQEIQEQLPSEILFPQYFHKSGTLAAARWGDDVNPEKKSDPVQFYIVTGHTFTKNELAALEKERLERFKQQLYRLFQSEAKDSLKTLYKEGNKQGIAQLRADLMDRANKESEERKHEVLYTEAQKETYYTLGGAPHLDGEYTVFGEVYEGMDIVKKINNAETHINDKPVKDIIIKDITLIK